MIKFRVLGPKTGPERQAGYRTNFPPTAHGQTVITYSAPASNVWTPPYLGGIRTA